MNILRELRKFKRKSVRFRASFVLIFLVMLLISTYAWFDIFQFVDQTDIKATIESWDIRYLDQNSEELSEAVDFTVQHFYPGMENVQQDVVIQNIGQYESNITYEVISVLLFGEEVLDDLKTNNEIQEAENEITLFTDTTKYPFEVRYEWDKKQILGDMDIKDGDIAPEATAKVSFKVSWHYENGKDDLDTEMGKKAYEFYQNPDNDPTQALKIMLRVTTKKNVTEM